MIRFWCFFFNNYQQIKSKRIYDACILWQKMHGLTSFVFFFDAVDTTYSGCIVVASKLFVPKKVFYRCFFGRIHPDSTDSHLNSLDFHQQK